eukprot:scaffold1085_cov407-Prasinococcus_capsulatus_cf.AAC.66
MNCKLSKLPWVVVSRRHGAEKTAFSCPTAQSSLKLAASVGRCAPAAWSPSRRSVTASSPDFMEGKSAEQMLEVRPLDATALTPHPICANCSRPSHSGGHPASIQTNLRGVSVLPRRTRQGKWKQVLGYMPEPTEHTWPSRLSTSYAGSVGLPSCRQERCADSSILLQEVEDAVRLQLNAMQTIDEPRRCPPPVYYQANGCVEGGHAWLLVELTRLYSTQVPRSASAL